MALVATACSHPNRATQLRVANATPPLVQHSDPKLVDFMIEPTTPLVLASATTELGIHVRIEGRGLPAAKRPPLDLALVLDTSGSMEGAAIEALRSSARQLVGKMRDGDRLAIVAFHSRAEVLVPNAPLDATSRAAALKAIDAIVARGTTDLQAGLQVGLQQVALGQQQNGINRIVLLSDGVPNAAEVLPALLTNIRQYGFAVTSLGLGVDYDTTLMTRVASETGGSFHYIEKPEQLAAVFDDELVKMTTVVGRNLHLILAPGPGVTIEPMAGFTPAGNGQVYATIGDLSAGAVRDLMIPIKVTARADGSTAELVDATLSFDDVIGQSGRQQRSGFASARSSRDQAAVTGAVKVDLEVARVRAAAASAILEAMALARQGQIEPAKKRLAAAAVMVRAAATRLKTAELDAL
ncbi:MAG: VWA domain-containing protein, partial [Deltaproteobacteria bacterium]|nr:VWA domain-containing protein [Deltaproteobacteria bacterium]